MFSVSRAPAMPMVLLIAGMFMSASALTGMVTRPANVLARSIAPEVPRAAVLSRSSTIVCAVSDNKLEQKLMSLQNVLDQVAAHSEELQRLTISMEAVLGVSETVPTPTKYNKDAKDINDVMKNAESLVKVTQERGSKASQTAQVLCSKLEQKEVSEKEARNSLKQTEATIKSLRAHTNAVETELARLRLAAYVDSCKSADERTANDRKLASLVKEQSSLSDVLSDAGDKLSKLTSMSNSLASTLGWVVAAAAAPVELKETAREAAARAAQRATAEAESMPEAIDLQSLLAAEEALTLAATAIQSVAAEAQSVQGVRLATPPAEMKTDKVVGSVEEKMKDLEEALNAAQTKAVEAVDEKVEEAVHKVEVAEEMIEKKVEEAVKKVKEVMETTTEAEHKVEATVEDKVEEVVEKAEEVVEQVAEKVEEAVTPEAKAPEPEAKAPEPAAKQEVIGVVEPTALGSPPVQEKSFLDKVFGGLFGSADEDTPPFGRSRSDRDRFC